MVPRMQLLEASPTDSYTQYFVNGYQWPHVQRMYHAEVCGIIVEYSGPVLSFRLLIYRLFEIPNTKEVLMVQRSLHLMVYGTPHWPVITYEMLWYNGEELFPTSPPAVAPDIRACHMRHPGWIRKFRTRVGSEISRTWSETISGLPVSRSEESPTRIRHRFM